MSQDSNKVNPKEDPEHLLNHLAKTLADKFSNAAESKIKQYQASRGIIIFLFILALFIFALLTIHHMVQFDSELKQLRKEIQVNNAKEINLDNFTIVIKKIFQQPEINEKITQEIVEAFVQSAPELSTRKKCIKWKNSAGTAVKEKVCILVLPDSKDTRGDIFLDNLSDKAMLFDLNNPKYKLTYIPLTQ